MNTPSIEAASLTCLFLALLISGCHEQKDVTLSSEHKEKQHIDSDFMYQYSVIDALLAGVYDGHMTFGKLKEHGDFGIGSFNHLDGELLINENEVYKMRYDGTIREVKDTDSTGIAFVKFFKADTILIIKQSGLTYQALQEKLKSVLVPNGLYAIRIKASFLTMKGRAPVPAQKPYPPLQPYLAKGGQHDFQFQNTTGVCVGFFLPPYMGRTNIPGFHVHFISNDKKNGGHIFEFTTNEVSIEIDQIKGYTVELNTHPDFGKVNLNKDRAKELEAVE
jgi:acetolactate decarboxylase